MSGNSKSAPTDLTGVEYWDSNWDSPRRSQVDLKSYYDNLMAKLFQKVVDPGSKVLEVGCGASVWLPYFGSSLQCEVWGIDYSERGAGLARRNLDEAGVSGRILLGDVFGDKGLPLNYFDLVWSFGFVEHFEDLDLVTVRLAEFLAPSGIVVTVIPNLHGLIGKLHALLDPNVFHTHRRIYPGELDTSHAEAGLHALIPAQYFGLFSIGVVNFSRVRRRLPRLVDRIIWMGIVLLQQSVCLPFRLLGARWESELLSPWILGVYRSADKAAL